MKKIFLISLLAGILFLQEQVFAQCPALSANSVTLDCSTPCATLTATPSVNLQATTTYSVSAVTYAPFSYSTGTTATFAGVAWSGGTDDSYGDIVTLPFNFCFFGTSYNQIVIGTNGNICFNAVALANAYDPYSISGPMPGSNCTATKNAIMGVWNDTYVGGGNIYYKTYGTAPCRQFVISWNAVDLFLPGSYCDGNHTTSQIVLYESSNIIDINIGSRTPCPAWNSGYAVCGIENNAGTTFYCPPGENGTTFAATSLAWRFTPTGVTSGWTYNWVAPGGTSVGTSASIVVCPTVTTTYTVTGTSGACTGVTLSSTSTVIVTSTTTPITGVATMCLGYTTSLTDATPGGVWTSSNTLVATVNTTGLVSSVGGGTSTISYTAAGCTSTVLVTVNTAPAITGVTLICAGGSSTLADAVTGGTWTSSNTGVATIGAASGLVTAIAPGATIITYVTPAGCVTTTTVNVFVLSNIGGTQVVCQGSTVTLTDNSPGGAWSSANPGIAAVAAGTGVVTGVSGGTTTITYSTGGGCYTTAVVTVNPLSPITGTVTMCQFYGTPLADAIPGGTWTSSNPAVAQVNNTTGYVYGATAGTATISYTSPAGCLMTTVVTVHPKPVPPVPTPQTYCSAGINSTPSAVAATPATGLTWYGPGITPGTTTNPTPATPLNPGTITYYVTETSSFGCVSDSATDVVHITPQPAPPVTSTSKYCQYSPVAPLNSQVDSAAGSHLTWFSLSGAQYAGTPALSDSVPNYPGGQHWLVQQTVNGCTSNRDTVTEITIYKPSFSISASRPWVCDHDTLIFEYSGSTTLVEGTYMWALPVGATLVEGKDTSNEIAVKFDSVNGQHYIYLTVGELNNMCTTTERVPVTVIALPTATGFTNPNICLGDTTSLSLSSESPSASIFGWYIDGIPLYNTGAVSIIAANSNSGGPFSIKWNATGLHIIKVTTTTEQGCKSEPTFDSVDVHALPNATFTFKAKFNSTLCLEDSVEFTANDTAYNDSYLWQPAHGFNNDNKRVIWGKVEEAQSDITLTVTDPFGCVGTSTQQLDPSVCCSVMFPNAFTPNGDGKNDVFRPLFNGYHNFHSFRIVNRWGETIFESSNSLPSWDGSFNGVPQDIGTYYYFIQYDCGGNTVEAKGDVTLIR